jgi:hypothetical protein
MLHIAKDWDRKIDKVGYDFYPQREKSLVKEITMDQ